MKRLFAIALLALAVAPASAGAWFGNVFQSPSGNLICKWRPSYGTVTCGRWNDQRIVSMTTEGRAREGAALSWRDESPHTLTYGRQWISPGRRITCGSYYNGIRCTNWNGHGFFIARAALNMW